MKVKFSKITQDIFLKLDMPIIFSNNRTDRCFGLLTNGINDYKCSWSSTITKPIIDEINNDIISIGIDQNFAIIDFNIGNIIINIKLFTNFFKTEIIKNRLYVITELEIIKLDKDTFDILQEFGLPDIFEEIELVSNKIIVKCFGGDIIEIS